MRRARRSGIAVLPLAVSILGATNAAAQAPADGWVVLPVDEYRNLRTRALAVAPETPPPVDATLTSVEYDLRAAGNALAGRARLTIDVIRDGWVEVPIPAGLLVRDARLDDAPVSLVKLPTPHVLLPRAGRFLLDLDIVAPVTASAGSESVTLPPAPAPIVQGRLLLPRTNVDLTVGGGFVAERTDTAAESRWSVLGQANMPLTLTWRRRVDDRRSELPLRNRARISQMVTLAEEVAAVSAAVRVEIVQGLASEVVLTHAELQNGRIAGLQD